MGRDSSRRQRGPPSNSGLRRRNEKRKKKQKKKRANKGKRKKKPSHLKPEKKIRICECPGGVPKVLGCQVHGQVDCEACDKGWWIKKNMFTNECMKNQCNCPNGKQAWVCPKQGQKICEPGSCDKYYRYENSGPFAGTCIRNKCHCEGRSGIPSMACEVNGEHKCGRCNRGYTMSDHKCYRDCSAGFTMEGEGKCVKNACKCDGGAPADHCVVHGAQNCQPGSCDAFFHTAGKRCLKNVGYCLNGEPVENFSKNGGSECKSCDSGYRLRGSQCIKNECQCPNGKVMDFCEENGSLACKPDSCDSTVRL